MLVRVRHGAPSGHSSSLILPPALNELLPCRLKGKDRLAQLATRQVKFAGLTRQEAFRSAKQGLNVVQARDVVVKGLRHSGLPEKLGLPIRQFLQPKRVPGYNGRRKRA